MKENLLPLDPVALEKRMDMQNIYRWMKMTLPYEMMAIPCMEIATLVQVCSKVFCTKKKIALHFIYLFLLSF